MEQIMNYVKPELVVVAVVLYFIGIGLKKSETVADKYIPAILGVVGVVVCGIYVVATCDLKGTQISQWQFSQRLFRVFWLRDLAIM